MIRILIVDDHDMVRQGLNQLLTSTQDMSVIGHARDGLEALHLCRLLQPDVVLMDVMMPGMDGMTATQIILEYDANIKIIVLSGLHDEAISRKAVGVGARRVLSKTARMHEILETVRTVSKGH